MQDQVATATNDSVGVARRTADLFDEYENAIHRRTDRLFAKLMVLQWFAGMVAALWISPRTWAGVSSWTHWHVWAAIFLGAMISSFPVFLVWLRPGHVFTRHTIAVAQMLTAALLIHLTGGRIETHFHVFGSLAFLACYRDWRVLATATAVVVVDHLSRGLFWPQSVYGVLTASIWRSFEHAGWVLFEDIVLLVSIRQSLKELMATAERQATLEAVNTSIEHTVAQRTADLTKEIAFREKAQHDLRAAHRQLVEASRLAGMSEVATGVLHNVGNVLNSVNVSANTVQNKVRNSKLTGLGKAAALLQEHSADLGSFLSQDVKGKQLPGYLAKLTEHLGAEQQEILRELDGLTQNIAHISQIVSMQQAYTKVSGATELVSASEIVEDALRLNHAAMERHHVRVVRSFEPVPSCNIDRHKALQVLVNLISNAKHALDANEPANRVVTLSVKRAGENRLRIEVADNGLGIAPENLDRIFSHGFTTRKDGHGFGLHSSILAAKELGGSLTVNSQGHGHGATFALELPTIAEEAKV